MEPPTKLDYTFDAPQNPEEDEDDEELFRQKGDWNQVLIRACGKGDLELVRKALSKKALVAFEDKKKWTPLIWASCKNYPDIVRLLITNGAAMAYFQKAEASAAKFCSGIVNDSVRQSPLQWASYKGNVEIVNILLHAGFSIFEKDIHGNNSAQLAAIGGNLEILKRFFALGVDIWSKNIRDHTIMDLATRKNILNAIQEHLDAKLCPHCNCEFNETKKKYLCHQCNNFVCKDYHMVTYYYSSPDSLEAEVLKGFCHDCLTIIENHGENLQRIMEEEDLDALVNELQTISDNSIDIDCKLLNQAQNCQKSLELKHQFFFLKSELDVVDDYTKILKNTHLIEKLLKNAEENNIEIPESVKEAAEGEIQRLIAERDLRFELDNLEVGASTNEQVIHLEELEEKARECHVADNYIMAAVELKTKMRKAIDAQEIYQLFYDYPVRPAYTNPIMLDPKTKRPIDPITKKAVDMKVVVEQQKKERSKRKGVKYVTPAWSDDLTVLAAKIKALEELLKQKDELDFQETFVVAATEAVTRMKKELQYRKALAIEQQIIADVKAAWKKKA